MFLRPMKKVLSTIVLFLGIAVTINAQLSQSELNKLNVQQRQIYLNQSKEINNKLKKLEADLFKAEEMIRMGQEMQRDNAKQAGSAHIIRGMNLKEKTIKDIQTSKEALILLDKAARDAIMRNEKNSQK